MLHLLKQYLTAFDDVVYRCGLEQRILYFDIFFNEMFIPCRVPTFRGRKVVNMAFSGVSHSCLLIELGPISKSKAASL